MEFKNVIFYCHFGAGDICESREFIKEWMRIVPAEHYYYAHGKNPKILRDIPQVEFTPITPEMKPEASTTIVGDTLYVNTWIGRDSRYVLPGVGTTLEEFYRMHNDMLAKLGLRRLSGEPLDYIHRIDYSYYPDIFKVNDFMMQHPEEKILIDNGYCQSLQAENFDFNPIITRLSGAYPDKLFITVQAEPPGSFSNIVSANRIIDTSDGFNLTEIAYISHFCSCLIGRNSGPHVHMQNFGNCMDEKKKLASFTYKATGSSFVVNSPVLIRKYWSPYENDEETFRRCKEIIDE